MRRASRSIPANLAEGWGVHTEANFKHFVSQALGSANEVQVHLDFAKDFGYLSEEQHTRLKRATTAWVVAFTCSASASSSKFQVLNSKFPQLKQEQLA